jgi:hypothetical protein
VSAAGTSAPDHVVPAMSDAVSLKWSVNAAAQT